MASGNCHLCARPALGGPHPATAEDKGSWKPEPKQETNYFSGIYRIAYVPTRDEMTRARED